MWWLHRHPEGLESDLRAKIGQNGISSGVGKILSSSYVTEGRNLLLNTMAERVGRGTPCLSWTWSLGAREVVGSRPGRGNSKESFSSNQEAGKVFSPEMPFYSKF